MGKYLFGADFGTSGVKAAILNSETGEKFMSSLFEYPTLHKQPLWAEQVPKEYWRAFCEACSEILGISGIDSSEIDAIGISSQGHGVIAIGADGDDLGDNMIWMDSRTDEQCTYMRENFAEDIAKVNGNSIKVLFPVPGILWEKKYAPEKYKKAVKYFGVSPYINYRLTGKFTVNPSEASLIHCFDVKNLVWSEDITHKLEIPVDKFPEIFQCGGFIGEVSPEAAAATGLKAGTKVIGGGHDTTSAALALGVVSVGQAFYSMGTGSNLGVITDEPKYDEAMTVQCYVIPEMWIFDAVMNSTGQSLKWFDRQFGQFEKQAAAALGVSSYDLYNLEAAKSQPGSGGVIYNPYLAGESSPIWDEYARASFIGITSRTTRADMIRAVMEGVCYSAYHNMKAFEGQNCIISELIVCGGPAKSRIWMQILADITGKIVKTTENEDAAPLGDAMLAAVACGHYKSYREAADKNVRIKDIYYPDPGLRETYDTLFEVYRNVYDKLKDDYRKIARF